MLKKKMLSVLLASVMVASVFAGCGKKEASEEKKENTDAAESADSTDSSGEKVTLHYVTYAVGTNVGAEMEKKALARFREKFGDTIDLVVEELPSDTVYTDKMKTLVSAGDLPNVIDGKNGLRDLAIKNGQAIDLTEFLNADPDFRDNIIGAEALAANSNTAGDGKIYSVVAEVQAVGYFYNKNIFEEAGIEPAKTWDEFWTNCDKLVEAGYALLALMTGENSWTTNLLLAAMVGGKGEAGVELMNTKYPETYQTPEMISALEDMQVALQKYTTPDALGAAYANAANNFLQEKAAIIFNGAWMINDFGNEEKAVPGLSDHIGFAMYPENGLIQTFAEGYTICGDDPKVQAAAWEFVKEMCSVETQMDKMELMGSIPSSSKIEITDEYKAEHPLFADNVEAVQKAEYSVSTFDVMAYATVVDAFGQYYPELAAGTLDAAGMAAKLDEAAAKAK